MYQQIENIIKEAGAIVLSATKIGSTVQEKTSACDLVTAYDTAVQDFLRSELKKAYPQFGFYGEENDCCETEGKVGWFIVDPIDGTTNYILTKMFTEGAAFDDVLKDAQAKVSLWIDRSRRRIDRCDKDTGEHAAVAVASAPATDSVTESIPEPPVTQPVDPGTPVSQLHKRLDLIKPRRK